MVLDHLTSRAHADHGHDWSTLVSDWWRARTPPPRRPMPRKPPVRLA